MTSRDFNRRMRSELHALTTIAEDLEDLASDERFGRVQVQQEMLGKAERVYDVVYAIRGILDRLMLGGESR